MLMDALQFVFDRAEKSAADQRPKLVPELKDERAVYYEHHGAIIRHDLSVPPRCHTVETLDDFILAVERWGDSRSSIWIAPNGTGVLAILNDEGDRRERVRLALHETAAFRRLRELEKAPKLDQQGLVRLLRYDLAGQWSPPGLLGAVRKIKFRSGTSGESSIQHGNESLGRTIEAEVTGADQIAEAFQVSAPVWSNRGEESVYTVQLDLEIVPASQAFLVRPCPDQITDVINFAMVSLRERLLRELSDNTVVFGLPE